MWCIHVYGLNSFLLLRSSDVRLGSLALQDCNQLISTGSRYRNLERCVASRNPFVTDSLTHRVLYTTTIRRVSWIFLIYFHSLEMFHHPKRVLAIQSHVVSGYVGSKCLVLPLNRLGFDVDVINSVQFSNNFGYPCVTGQILSAEELDDLVDGLEKNDLLDLYTHMLTGYIGSTSMLQSIAKVVRELKEKNPQLVYMCDPVCGDNGELYADPALPLAFEQVLLPLATIITPNQFEAELLTRMKISSVEDASIACALLHDKGPSIVVITSIELPEKDGIITVFTSAAGTDGAQSVFSIDVPKIDEHFLGTGDLFASLLLGWMDRYPENLPLAMELAVGGLQAVLHDTSEKASKAFKKLSDIGKMPEKGDMTWWKCRELRLVDNQDKILCPEICQRATHVSCCTSA